MKKSISFGIFIFNFVLRFRFT